MEQELAEAIDLAIARQISARIPKVRIGRFVGFETDTTLCAVSIGTTVYRYIPYLYSNLAIALTQGDLCLLIGGEGLPMILVGNFFGNLAASDGSSSPV